MSLDDVLAKINKVLDFRKEGTFAGIKFELHILSLQEEQLLNEIDSDEMDGVAYFNEMRKTALSYAIRKIDDEEIPDIVKTKDASGADVTKERAVYIREILNRFPNKLIETLFEMYVDLREEAEHKMDSEIEYKWFKDPDIREQERKKAAQEAMKEIAESGKVLPQEEPEAKEEDITFRKVEEPVEPEENDKSEAQ